MRDPAGLKTPQVAILGLFIGEPGHLTWRLLRLLPMTDDSVGYQLGLTQPWPYGVQPGRFRITPVPTATAVLQCRIGQSR